LFLNIYTPYLPHVLNNTKNSGLKPVMFYIHGGGFYSGTGADPTYDGGNLASRGDVVVVTINYRLGMFGFLALDDGSTNGNFGFADQTVALDWVRANIASFGGNPDRITIFGQSAGAVSTLALLGSPKAAGKFSAAMPLSNLAGQGAVATYDSYASIGTVASTVGKAVLTGTGCKNVTCLRSLNASQLLPFSNETMWVDLVPLLRQFLTFIQVSYK
jgi:carboxylesterase type B